MISIITVESCAGQPFAAMAQHASMAMQTAIALNQWNNVSSPFHVGLVPMQPDDPYSRSSARCSWVTPLAPAEPAPTDLALPSHLQRLRRNGKKSAKRACAAQRACCEEGGQSGAAHKAGGCAELPVAEDPSKQRKSVAGLKAVEAQ